MGVAAAKLAAPPVLVQTGARMAQRACECGAGAGLSGRCGACDRTGLARAAPQPAAVAQHAPDAGAGHNLARIRIQPAVRQAAPVGPQTRLRVSAPGDAAEQEAHAVARLVAGTPDPAPAVLALPANAAPTLQRQETGAHPARADALDRLHDEPSVGAAMPGPVRKFMETRFGADFGGVRIHADDRAAALSGELAAQAFTVGRDIYFGRNQFQPGTPGGRELIAHELTHTIQQGGVAQLPRAAIAAPPTPTPTSAGAPAPAPARVAARAPASVQRSGITDPWGYFAEQANNIPGFRMLTIVLGVNPLTMSRVDPSPANVLKAIIEFLPGGALVVQALQNSGIFDKVGAWVADQLATLKMTGSALRDAAGTFISQVKFTDVLLDFSSVWEKAKRIFTEPIQRLISFVEGLFAGILKFIKDAILVPLAKLAEGTPGWALLTAVLGRNPITHEDVPQTAETIIGPFMTLIGQAEVWENMKKANAIPRAWAWAQNAMTAVKGFVSQIPDLFIAALSALTIEDVVLVVGAFKKVSGVFGGFLVRFTDWAGTAVWNLLEIIFDVVSPGALSYIKKTGSALKSIFQNPLPFVGNLVKAAKLGFENFAANIGTHLKTGLIEWLTGAVPGVYIPKSFTLAEFGKLALSVLGITWAQIRAKIVKALGPSGEIIMKGLEATFDVVMALVHGGPAAAWELIKEKLTDLKDTLINGIQGFVIETIVTKAVPKLISLFVPGAGFISAIVSIYDTIMVFVNKLAKIAEAVKAFVDSIVAIAQGQIAGAAAKVESTLAGLLSLAISFLAGFLGLGNIADKVTAVIAKVRGVVDKALDSMINWLVGKAKALFAGLFGKKDDKPTAAGAFNAVVPFQMSGVGHQLSIVVGPTNLRIRMASSRADYLRLLITGAEKALSNRPNHSENDVALLAELRRLDKELVDLEETRIASVNDQYGPEGNALRAKITDRMTGIARLLAAVGQAFGLSDLEHLTHPSRYVGHLIGPNRYALLPKYSTAKRARFFPSGYRQSVDKWIQKQKDESPKPGYWRDGTNNIFYPNSVTATIDHKTPVATHWNQESGNDEKQSDRAEWYNIDGNFQLATSENNRSEGARGEKNMINEVGIKFTGPSE